MNILKILSFVTMVLVLAGTAAAQDGEKEPAVEISVDEESPAPELSPGEKIVPEGEEVPEVPKPLRERTLTPAEKERLAQLEQKRAKGDLTEPEYDLEKDNLVRESNIKF